MKIDILTIFPEFFREVFDLEYSTREISTDCRDKTFTIYVNIQPTKTAL
jgi:tRNA G37 N-methylase TrmD